KNIFEFVSKKEIEIQEQIADLKRIGSMLKDLKSRCPDQKALYQCPIIESLIFDKNFKFKLATCAFVNFAVIENTFLYAVVSNFISLLNASLAVRYPNILRGRLFIHCCIFLIVCVDISASRLLLGMNLRMSIC